MSIVAIIHPSLNRLGGSERLCLEMIRVFKGQGSTIHLYTIDRTNWGLMERNWGVKVRPDRETYRQTAPLNLSDSASWAWAAATYLWTLQEAQIEGGLSINNYGEVFPFVSDISYIHSRPLVAVEGDPYGVPIWGYSRKVYDALYRRLSQTHPSGRLLTNSTYNMGLVKAHIHRDTRVVHPFIEPVAYRGEPKTGNVLTVSRIAPGKNLAIILEVAQRIRGPRFILAGRIQEGSEKVLAALRRQPRLEIHTNPTREDLLGLMTRSSVYLSTQPDEGFGISVLEAMSAGCVPVIPRDGGPWHDILRRRDGEAGLSYRDPDEAAEGIREILGDDQLREELRAGAVERSRSFTLGRFERELAEALDGVEPHRPMGGRLAEAYRYVRSLRPRLGGAYQRGVSATRKRVGAAIRRAYAGQPASLC